ncbi:MAG: glycosyltransferase family 8 protein [Lactobacillus porci]|nr:glycosyltransferase family 8 protein [Lactobacillus porci]
MTIPVFYSISDDFTPYAAVSLNSLVKFSDPAKDYTVVFLHQGLSADHRAALAAYSRSNVHIEFHEMSEDQLAPIQNRKENFLRAEFFTLSIFYRLFIPDLFPQYDKLVYIDADTVLNADIAGLYEQDLNGKLIGACRDGSIQYVKPLQVYIKDVLGLPNDSYINSGMLVMDAKQLREKKFLDKFFYLLGKYHFNSIAPDQDYINEICSGQIQYLDPRWDAMPNEVDPEMPDPCMIHYNLFYKPWHFEHTKYERYFWGSAKETVFYNELKQELAAFSDADRQKEMGKMDFMVARVKDMLADPNNWLHVKQSETVTL